MTGGEMSPERYKLWLPLSYRRHVPAIVPPAPVRYRRSLLRWPLLSACVIIAALWVMVWFGQPTQRADAVIWCGTTLAIVIAVFVGVSWFAVEATAIHIRWVAIPSPGNVEWKNIRSAQMRVGKAPTTQVSVQWMVFVVHDPVRSRDVRRYLSTQGLPRHEFFSHCADLAEASNPELAATLRQAAASFEPTNRSYALGSHPAAFWCASGIGAFAAVAAALTALLSWTY